MTFAGLGWLAFLWPPFANSLQPYILMPGLVGEGSLTPWLLTMGVNPGRNLPTWCDFQQEAIN
jgi:hypothetical protein